MTTLRVRMYNPLYPKRNRYANSAAIQEFVEYEGEVVKPKPKWVSDDHFCLTTGDARFPLRILVKDDIVDGWLIKSNSQKTYQIKDKYFVTKNGSSYVCTCTGFSYRRNCSHVQEVMSLVCEAA